MKYQFILSYKATDSETVMTNTCHPVYGDDLSVTIDREDGEWYYKRKLDGKITFERDDYRWIMARPFDGTFTLTINETHDGGASWHPYFEGTFSRANLEIDEDNQAASLSSFIEGVYNAIENGKNEDYDLMKLIPDSEAKTVQGQVPPALALYDECSAYLKPSFSDIYCNAPIIGGGYISEVPLYYAADKDMRDNSYGTLQIIWAEAKLTMKSNNYFPAASGHYTGALAYRTNIIHGIPQRPDVDFYFVSIDGTLSKENNAFNIRLVFENDHVITEQGVQYFREVSMYAQLITSYNSQEIARTNRIHIGNSEHDEVNPPTYSPITLQFQGTTDYGIDSLSINIHYVYASILLANDVNGTTTINFLDTSKYYKRSKKGPTAGWLGIYPSVRTVERPNGHRMVPGSDTPTSIPQYFAPPFDGALFIPLSEENWTYASLWYLDPGPTFQNLFTSEYFGSFPWTRCWTLGTVLRHLLDRITDGKVVFTEDTTSSQFLYSTVNPVNQHEPFDYLITQKSNVMRPSNGGESAARCPVRLNWFLELLRNAFNCYYWLEKRNDGKYLFRVEHI
ncbi:MAG: hypothetical protein IIZ44_03075, partial [Muribaculaceae bacterium]|nr:hypothetical protein [Muribaculaceae bacterium]